LSAVLVNLHCPLFLTALESELLLGDAARAAAEADLVKMRKELATAVTATAASDSVSELVSAKETLQAQLNSEKRRIQQLEHDVHQLQQHEQLLQSKIASISAAAAQKQIEHAAALADMRQQLQHDRVRAEGSGAPLHRTAAVEHSLSEGELAQQAMAPKLFCFYCLFIFVVLLLCESHNDAVIWDFYARLP
jgi:hypothetical protein